MHCQHARADAYTVGASSSLQGSSSADWPKLQQPAGSKPSRHAWHLTACSRAVVQGAVQKLPAPKELFQALYCHFLRLADADLRLDDSVPPAPGMTTFADGNAEADRLLCVRALASVYHEHAAAIGAPPLPCMLQSLNDRRASLHAQLATRSYRRVE